MKVSKTIAAACVCAALSACAVPPVERGGDAETGEPANSAAPTGATTRDGQNERSTNKKSDRAFAGERFTLLESPSHKFRLTPLDDGWHIYGYGSNYGKDGEILIAKSSGVEGYSVTTTYGSVQVASVQGGNPRWYFALYAELSAETGILFTTTGTLNGTAQPVVILQDDGNLVVYSEVGGKVLWDLWDHCPTTAPAQSTCKPTPPQKLGGGCGMTHGNNTCDGTGYCCPVYTNNVDGSQTLSDTTCQDKECF